MEKLRDIFVFICFIGGASALILGLYQAWNDKLLSALGLGIGFVLCAAFLFLSQVKTLKLWELQVELHHTLDQAKEVMASLQRLSIVSAKSTYMQMAWGNRMGSPTAVEKQAMLDEVDNQLIELKVRPEERRALTETYVRLIGFDFYMMYARTLERYFQFKQQQMTSEVIKNSESQLRAELERWKTGRPSWRPNYSLFTIVGVFSFEDEIRRITPEGWLSEQDQRAVNAYRDRLLSIFKGVQAKGGYTKEAAEFYDKYHDLGGQDKKIIELFGFNPSEIR